MFLGFDSDEDVEQEIWSFAWYQLSGEYLLISLLGGAWCLAW
jgi:hypothetical protein